LNRIRRENSALQETNNIQFLTIENEYLLGFLKMDEQRSNTILVLINMDPYAHQVGRFSLPLGQLKIPARQSYLAHELLTDTRLFWQGENHAVTIDPDRMPAQIYRIQRRVKRENDFDYFM
jgi:starch synthase (maltosyl-transferring)